MTLMTAIKGYFDERNRMWVEGDERPLIAHCRLSPAEDWWNMIRRGMHLTRRAMHKRGNQILRAHTKIRVPQIDAEQNQQVMDARIEETVTWVYRDGPEYGVESRLIYHTQRWREDRNGWKLEWAAESSEPRIPNHVNRIRLSEDESPAEPFLGESFRQCSKYDRVRAQRYAELWWNGFNTSYVSFQEDDCTNFISQCLFAGGLKMTGGQNRASGWWYRFGGKGGQGNWSYSWATSNGLHAHLVQHAGAKSVRSAQELKIGDVIFYDWQGDGKFNHSVMVVDYDQSGDPLVNAHSDASYHRHYLYLDSRAWTEQTRYAFVQIPDVIC